MSKGPGQAEVQALEAITCVIDGVVKGVMYGHASSAARPETPLALELFDGEKSVLEFVADHARPDLTTTDCAQPKCGFELPLPQALFDGQKHVLSVRMRDYGSVPRVLATSTLILRSADGDWRGEEGRVSLQTAVEPVVGQWRPVESVGPPPDEQEAVTLGVAQESAEVERELVQRLARLIHAPFLPVELQKRFAGDPTVAAKQYLEDPGLWSEPIHPLFDALYYCAQVGTLPAGISPFEHYLRFGGQGNLQPHPVFQTWWYRMIAGDLGGLTPLEHYLLVADRMRTPNPLFSPEIFLDSLPFKYPAEANPLALFIWLWPRKIVPFSEYVDYVFYGRRHPETLQLVDPLTHYFGLRPDNRGDLNPRFFRGWYFERNGDLHTDSRDVLLHFLVYGAEEGRLPNPLAEAELAAMTRMFPDTPVGELLRDYIKVRRRDMML